MTNQGDVAWTWPSPHNQQLPPWASTGPTCHDCDPVECDEVTIERAGIDIVAREFMATQEGKGQS